MVSFIHNPYIEIIIRALSVYFFIIIALRLFGKKELAQLSVIDLVFILLISNSVQNAMVGSNSSLEGGILAALSLFAANYLLKKLFYKHKSISDLIQGGSVHLIYKGKIDIINCEKAEISIDELSAAVREHGILDISEVYLAMLEVDGNISVVSNDFQRRANVIHPKLHKLKGRLNKS